MDFFEKDSYSQADIELLVKNKYEESVHLDFKEARALCNTDHFKKEISKDVAAFANSDGGIIVYGIAEREHVAAEYSFIDGDRITKEWLEQVICSSIQQRISDVKIFPVRFDEEISRTIYLVKIPRSNSAPHMSSDKCYYKRFNFQSVKMEEYEVRELFGRKNQSKLEIKEATFTVDPIMPGDEEVTLNFFATIHNQSNTTETLYKLNLYFNLPDSMVKSGGYIITWDKIANPIEYTAFYHRLKVSCNGTFPIFPGEISDFGRFKFKVQLIDFEVFKQSTIDLKLFYTSNEVDEKTYTIRDIIIAR